MARSNARLIYAHIKKLVCILWIWEQRQKDNIKMPSAESELFFGCERCIDMCIYIYVSVCVCALKWIMYARLLWHIVFAI